MASLTWWTWVWVNSGSLWWTGRPGLLRFMGSQRVGYDWATELNWTELKVQLNLTWSMKDMLWFQLQSYFCPSSQTFKPKLENAVFSPSLNIWCVQPKHAQLVLIRTGQTLKNLHQWSNAGGQTSLAKLTRHFCKITYRFIKLPVIFLHGWDPKHICVPVDVLFKLKQKVNNCPISITENMGPERRVCKRQIKWEGGKKKTGIPRESYSRCC